MGKYVIVIVLILAASNVFAQAKVGTTGAQFLELSPSVRANGMGAAGMTLTSDRSYFLNPATLGLIECRRVRMSLYPFSADFPSTVDYWSEAVALRLRTSSAENPWSIAVAYHAVWLKSGDMVERSYGNGSIGGTTRTFSWNDHAHQATFAVGWSRRIEIAGGVTLKYIRESAHEYSADGGAGDIGGIVRVPLNAIFESKSGGVDWSRFRIDFGVSLCNVGPDLKYVQRKYPLPDAWHFGLGLCAKFNSVTLYPAVQIDRRDGGFYDHHFGMEAEWREAITGRVGTFETERDYRTTFGASLKSLGLYRLISGREWRFPISFEASYAYMSGFISGSPGENYYGIELVL